MVVYRKYRPTSFNTFLGNEIVKSILISSIQSGSLASAYLFSGPRGTGKTTLARVFAKAINCDNFTKSSDACNECSSCLSINNSSSADIIEIDAASNRGVDDIRALRDAVNFVPTSLKYKIYIIDEVHMLTPVAFNAFLKTLEEPPPQVIFILATTEPHKLPNTILSRVQRFDIKLQSLELITSKLSYIAKAESKDVPQDIFNKIYKLSGGSFRDAESLFGKILASEKNLSDEDVIDQLLGINSNIEVHKLINTLTQIYHDKAIESHIKSLTNIFENCINLQELIDSSLLELNDLLFQDRLAIESYTFVSAMLLAVKKHLKLLNKNSLINYITVYLYEKLVFTSSKHSTTNSPVESQVPKQNNMDEEMHSELPKLESKSQTIEVEAKVNLPSIIKQIFDTATVTKSSNTAIISVKSTLHLLELNKERSKEIVAKFLGVDQIEVILTQAQAVNELQSDEIVSEVDNSINSTEVQPVNNKDLVEEIF